MTMLLQVRLKDITIVDNGYWQDQQNVLAFTLIYPREGVPSVSTARTAMPAPGQRYDYRATVAAAGEPYTALLFRETIRAETALIVEISARRENPRAAARGFFFS